MANWPKYQYDGHGKAPSKPRAGVYDKAEPYRPASKDLIDAVNLSIFLGRPLLLEGEAGSGKSRLAYAVAYELGLPLKVWPVRSNSRAEDGLYHFDAIQRLYDAQAAKEGIVDPKHNPSDYNNYIRMGALGEAFEQTDYPAVVLIDEIDKADLDFPNDLLNVLEDGWFRIRETDKVIKAKHKPIIFITSNKEKGNLPLPFLRRCVYLYLRFPEKTDELMEIIQRHYPDEQNRDVDIDLAKAAVARFLQIRSGRLHKKPGTSELLDWVAALHFFKDKAYKVKELEAPESVIPYPELLFKLQVDMPTRTP